MADHRKTLKIFQTIAGSPDFVILTCSYQSSNGEEYFKYLKVTMCFFFGLFVFPLSYSKSSWKGNHDTKICFMPAFKKLLNVSLLD